jgi:hypothetical protein
MREKKNWIVVGAFKSRTEWDGYATTPEAASAVAILASTMILFIA